MPTRGVRVNPTRLSAKFLVLPVICPWGASEATFSGYRIAPDSPDALPFEVVIQYTVVGEDLNFSVCADSSAASGRLDASLEIADSRSALASVSIVSEQSPLGQAWTFSIRKDLLSTSTFSLVETYDALFPSGQYWVFDLEQLTRQSFHVELEPVCPRWHCTLPRNEVSVPDFHVLRLSARRPASSGSDEAHN
jgi:hypothetical protein